MVHYVKQSSRDEKETHRGGLWVVCWVLCPFILSPSTNFFMPTAGRLPFCQICMYWKRWVFYLLMAAVVLSAISPDRSSDGCAAFFCFWWKKRPLLCEIPWVSSMHLFDATQKIIVQCIEVVFINLIPVDHKPRWQVASFVLVGLR